MQVSSKRGLSKLSARIPKDAKTVMAQMALKWNVPAGRIHSLAIEYALFHQPELFTAYLTSDKLTGYRTEVSKCIATCRVPRSACEELERVACEMGTKLGRIQALCVEFTVLHHPDKFNVFLENNKPRLYPYDVQ